MPPLRYLLRANKTARSADMTRSICLACFEEKGPVLDPCPACGVEPTAADLRLGIAFSDHHIPYANFPRVQAELRASRRDRTPFTLTAAHLAPPEA
jgi:hypothetical protein